VHVDARHAILEFSKPQHTVYPYTQHETPGTHKAFAVSSDSERYHTIDGKVSDHKMFDELSDIFKTKDDYVRLHANFPQYVRSPPISYIQAPVHPSARHPAINRVCSTSCSASPPRPP
jgi:hypothetical protein